MVDDAQEVLRHAQSVLNRKTEDYNPEGDESFAFEFVGDIIESAIKYKLNSQSIACLALLSVKLARAISLLSSNDTANFEPLFDTCADGANYFALLYSINQKGV